MKKNILIVGGAGFIGSHVIRLFVKKYPQYQIINFDALTYAGNLENLRDIENSSNYTFFRGDITDPKTVQSAFEQHQITDVINLAAETHVDRSIEDPTVFVKTNVIGTTNLLNTALQYWKPQLNNHTFHQISTDEVFGSLGSEGFFTEDTPYDPQSPYSASKAAADHLVNAYHNTYQLRTIISNCSNNYGPNQFPEKLIPLFINNIVQNKPLPVYGDGLYTRDWLYVIDHATAIDTVFHKGSAGQTYNIGGHNEWTNLELIKLLCKLMDTKLNRSPHTSEKLITFVKDRPGHDRRYAIDAKKIEQELGWTPSVTFETGISLTIDWYLENKNWLQNVTSGDYQKYYQKMYADRQIGTLKTSQKAKVNSL